MQNLAGTGPLIAEMVSMDGRGGKSGRGIFGAGEMDAVHPVTLPLHSVQVGK